MAETIVFHVLTQSRYEAGLIEQALRCEDYEAMFVHDDLSQFGPGRHVVILEPSLSDWQWLDRLTQVSKDHPATPVVLYTREALPENDVRRICRDIPVFVVGDITTLKDRLGVVIEQDPASPKTVLFVDDDENTIKAYLRTLRKTPWTILSTTSGEDALETLKQQPVDCIVTDIKMPNLHGLELISKIRETDKDVPIVICSGYPGMKDDDSLKFHDIAGFIEKPVDEVTLKQTLEGLLG
ncbi:MAG: response regulator [Deltaproteobacteria bacterium]|nr:response regulator [Deltaproteobacteria bacterium]